MKTTMHRKTLWRRSAATLLALCLCVGLLPGVGGLRAEAADLVTYDFIEGFSTGVHNLSEIDYTGRSWSFEDTSMDIASNPGSLRLNIGAWDYNFNSIQATSAWQWFSVRINIATAGRYLATLQHAQCNNFGSTGNSVYLAPASVTDSAERMSAQYKVGVVDYNNSDVTDGTIKQDVRTDLGIIDVPQAGEYIISFVGTGNQFPRAFILGDIPVFSSAALAVDKTKLTVGETAQCTPSGLMDNGSAAVLTDATISYSSSAPEVASVDASGVVTGNADGVAGITVEITLDGVTKTATKYVAVSSGTIKYAKTSAEYDFISGFTGVVNFDAIDFTGLCWSFEDSAPWLKELSTRLRVNVGTFSWSFNSITAQTYTAAPWFSLRVNIAAPGKYSASLKHAQMNGSTAPQSYVFLAPEAVADSTSRMENTFQIGTVDYRNGTVPTSDTTIRQDVITQLGTIEIPAAGDYIITFKSIGNQYPRALILNGNLSELWSAELSLTSDTIEAGATASVASLTALMDDDTPASGYTLGNYTSSSPAVATVNAATGEVTGVAPGTAKIRVPVTLNGVTRTAEKTVTVTAAAANAAVNSQVIITANDADIAATAISATINGAPYTAFGSAEDVPVGGNVSMTAQNSLGDGKTFHYWKDTSGRVVSSDLTYTFTAGTNTRITAVYRPAPTDGTVLVEFFDKNGKVLQSTTPVKNSVINAPATPFSVGYNFLSWSNGFVDGVTTAANSISFVAQYEKDMTPFTVTVIGGTGGGTFTYNDEVTVTADADADTFACWMKNGKIVSYDREYSFYVWDTTTVTAVTKEATDEIIKVPSIAMDTLKLVNVGGVNRAICCAERTVPEGYTLIETGILIVTGGTGEITLDTVGAVKAIAQSKQPSGQFTARKDNPVGTERACAYLIYKVGDDYKVIYSNIVGAV